MKAIFDKVSADVSRSITREYSTSFSLGIKFLAQRFRDPIYAVYGFVRLADEIVDSFHDFDRETLLRRFVNDTHTALSEGISLNPVLNAFQKTFHAYGIRREMVDQFFRSMQTDLRQSSHTSDSYGEYIFGSAEVVGLMCLKIFTENDISRYEALKPYAMRLGSAFQKVNFLRDAREDYQRLGRTYFPNVKIEKFSQQEKLRIEEDIRSDFDAALIGIRMLPQGAKSGVYLAYFYYRKLFEKIVQTDASRVMQERIRIPDGSKLVFLCNSYVRHRLNLI